MKINRNYKNLKLLRTYIGGSKEKELEIFMQVQNVGGECNWIEYRRILFPYLEDVLHTNFSRSVVSKILSYVFMIFAFFLGLTHFAIFSILVLLLSILFRVLFIYFKKKVKEAKLSYNLSFITIKKEIKNLTGLDI
jgi:predicted exporter